MIRHFLTLGNQPDLTTCLTFSFASSIPLTDYSTSPTYMPRRNVPPDTDSPPSWVETTTNHRRFPKRGVASSSTSGSSTTSHSAFSVSSILGTYAIRCPALERANEHHATADAPPVQMTFDVHGIVRRRAPGSARGGKSNVDSGVEMEGLWASLAWGVLNGVALIGGSRRGLREVVQTVEEMEEEDAEATAAELAERKEVSKGVVHGNGNYEKVYPDEDDDDDDADKDDSDGGAGNDAEDDEDEILTQSELPPPQRPLFEKNTFRQPKFFFEWRGHDALSSTNVSRGPRSDHMGHLEFTSGACKEFKGVFSSERWGENVAFEGWKVRGAGKGGGAGSRCPHTWGEFDDVSGEQH